MYRIILWEDESITIAMNLGILYNASETVLMNTCVNTELNDNYSEIFL